MIMPLDMQYFLRISIDAVRGNARMSLKAEPGLALSVEGGGDAFPAS